MRELKIKNLILIESQTIRFNPHLNIITGETGSGKSALLEAIRLISGQRADSNLIRTNADFAIIESTMDNGQIIRREVYRSGKNRCFIDDAQVTLSELKSAVNIELVDQNSSSAFFLKQIEMLDQFSQTQNELEEFLKADSERKRLVFFLEGLSNTSKEKELEWAQKDLALIEEIHYKPNEEEKLSQEHTLLTRFQELAKLLSDTAYLLNESTELQSLKTAQNALFAASKIDSELISYAKELQTALIEIDEVGRSVQSYLDRMDLDPARLMEVEKRLGEITLLQRRFGKDIEKIKFDIIQRIDHLTHLDEEIQETLKKIHSLENRCEKLKSEITKKRKQGAEELSLKVRKELFDLNLKNARFEIVVKDSFNEIEFLFSANPGSSLLPVSECASGGELSRLLLAIKNILSTNASTIVFDEIDSNVGGQTAAILGEKLKKLSENKQIICVTHFVQVAKNANDHFYVYKETEKDQTLTFIRKLSEKEKEIEYHRMLGTLKK